MNKILYSKFSFVVAGTVADCRTWDGGRPNPLAVQQHRAANGQQYSHTNTLRVAAFVRPQGENPGAHMPFEAACRDSIRGRCVYTPPLIFLTNENSRTKIKIEVGTLRFEEVQPKRMCKKALWV